MHDRLLRATCARTLAPAFVFLAFVIAGALMATASDSAPARITIKSGTPQSAHAWAPPGTNLYETTFTTPLVVTVTPKDVKIRFSCVTPGCIFPPQEQGENIERAAPNAFDATAEHGVASIKLVIRSVSTQEIAVDARPAGNPHAPSARFRLTAR